MAGILLVDDHNLFREGLKAILTAHGLNVVGEAGDGAEAIAAVHELHPDLVLMDLEMPGMGGLEATRLLKAEYPDLSVVILTASEADADLFEAVKSGAQGYLLKRYDPKTIIDLVNDAVRGEPALTPQLAGKILNEFARVSERAPDAHAAQPAAEKPGEGLIEPLTGRERDVLELLVTGATNSEIARRLVVTENTVKYHLKNILQKLHLHNRSQVVAYALSRGVVPPPLTEQVE
jgi:DNA-binding NarL/FixJ family response regulator